MIVDGATRIDLCDGERTLFLPVELTLEDNLHLADVFFMDRIGLEWAAPLPLPHQVWPHEPGRHE